MDFDDEDKPKEVSKTRRFAPGKSKPKPEPIAEKAEPPSRTDVSKSEHDVDVAGPKVESEVYKMEIDSKVDNEVETTEVELMEEDQEEEEEEDVVVREIDVFFNPSIDANTMLYVLQYPLRPSWRPYEMDERCEQSQSIYLPMEIDLSMDVNSQNYDLELGSKLNMTKQNLATTWKQPASLDYAVGILSGDKLHLNPVHAVAQLRPSMQYLTSDQNQFLKTYLKGMMSNGNSSIDFNMSPDVYINSLCTSLKRVLTSLPLEERVQKLLCEGSQLVRYSVLKHYAPELSDKDLLKMLEQYAWLVQGLWTPKTRLLKLDGPSEASRDYVLILFSKGLTIKYSEVDATRLSNNVKSMLMVFGRERKTLQDWKFKESPDVSFIKSYPKIVSKYSVHWKTMEERLVPKMTQGVKGASSRNKTASEKMPDVRKALKKVFQTHKVCSFETIYQGLRDLADSSMAVTMALGADAHKEEVEQVINQVAVNIHGSFVSKSSPDHLECDPLRNVVIDLFLASVPGKKLMKADVIAVGEIALGRKITNNEYNKVMHDICETNSSGWVLHKPR